MRYQRLIGAAFLTAAFLSLPSTDAWGQNKKKPKEAVGGTADSEKIPAGEYVGVLKSTPGTDRTFTLEIETTKLVGAGKGGGRPGGGRGGAGNTQRVMQIQAQMQQAQMQMARARTPQQRQQAMNRLRQMTNQLRQAIAQLQRSGGGAAPPGFRYEKSKVLVEFQASEKAKVRTLVLPETFDDKGNLKKYSAKELAELKGKDRASPGYESALEKLEVGQKVKVVTTVVARAGGSKVDKDKDDDVTDEKSKQAKLIVVLEAADPAVLGKEKRKKK